MNVISIRTFSRDSAVYK